MNLFDAYYKQMFENFVLAFAAEAGCDLQSVENNIISGVINPEKSNIMNMNVIFMNGKVYHVRFTQHPEIGYHLV